MPAGGAGRGNFLGKELAGYLPPDSWEGGSLFPWDPMPLGPCVSFRSCWRDVAHIRGHPTCRPGAFGGSDVLRLSQRPAGRPGHSDSAAFGCRRAQWASRQGRRGPTWDVTPPPRPPGPGRPAHHPQLPRGARISHGFPPPAANSNRL